MVRIPRSGVLKGLILGLSLASVLSAWVTLVRLVAGTAPFTRAETTYPALLGLYYGGGLLGGLLIGLAWPLRKWLLGSAVLGVFGIFPLYFAALLMDSPRTQPSGAGLIPIQLARSGWTLCCSLARERSRWRGL